MDYQNENCSDLDSPTHFPSVNNDDIRKAFLEQTARDLRRSQKDSYPRKNDNSSDGDTKFHDSISKAVLLDFNKNGDKLNHVIEEEEHKTELKADFERMDLEEKSDAVLEEIEEAVIVPQSAMDEKGAFITKMDDDHIEFVEDLISRNTANQNPILDADRCRLNDDDSGRRPSSCPLVLHVAHARATATTVNVGDCSTLGRRGGMKTKKRHESDSKTGEETKSITQKASNSCSNLEEDSTSTNHVTTSPDRPPNLDITASQGKYTPSHVESPSPAIPSRPWMGSSSSSTNSSLCGHPPISAPATADSGVGHTPGTTRAQSGPWEWSHGQGHGQGYGAMATRQNQGQTSDGGTDTSQKGTLKNQETPQSSGRWSTSTYSSSSSTGSDMSPKDVMISYSHTDRDMMKKIKAKLEAAGISVWVDSTGLRSGVDFLSKIGQAIIDAKLFVSLVSPKCLASKFCRDELSLAYISDKYLFPVALNPLDQLVAVMDTGLKLVLTRLEWTLLYEKPHFDARMEDLVLRMQRRLAQKATELSVDSLMVPRVEDQKTAGDAGGLRLCAPLRTATEPQEASADGRRESWQTLSKRRRSRKTNTRHSLNRQHSIYRPAGNTPLRDSSDSSRESLGICSFSLTPSLEGNPSILFFWERNLGNADAVPWSKFEGEFRKEYGEELDHAYNRDEQKWMLEILYKELIEEDDATDEDVNVNTALYQVQSSSQLKTAAPVKAAALPNDLTNRSDKLVYKSKYEEYCNVDGVMYPFWDRLQSQAVEKFAMKAVFSMESEPAYRLKAIENLSKFKSTAVVEALIDLLWDKDPNIRAIAAISVAKSGYDTSSRRSESDEGSIEDVDDLLIGLLRDKDRLVRESACIALGHRRCQKVVPLLLHFWRNDNISSVREAAQLALRHIGGEEASRAIHMTTILQDEMKTLMDLNI